MTLQGFSVNFAVGIPVLACAKTVIVYYYLGLSVEHRLPINFWLYTRTESEQGTTFLNCVNGSLNYLWNIGFPLTFD